MTLTEKKALEIVAHPEKYCDNPMLHQQFDNAKGFLEGVQAERKRCAEIARRFECPCACDDPDLDEDQRVYCGNEVAEEILKGPEPSNFKNNCKEKNNETKT